MCENGKGRIKVQMVCTAVLPIHRNLFDDRTCGVQPDYQLTEDASEADYFTNFFDGEVASTMCKETNRYAASLIADLEYTYQKEGAGNLG